jgi:diguanylate cyclase (GGDEF)-like protein
MLKSGALRDPERAPKTRRRPCKRGFVLGVRSVVAAVALVPLLGLTWLATAEVREVTEEVARTEQIEDRSAELDRLIRAAALLDQELYWASAIGAITELGLPLDVVGQVTGLDLQTEYLDAQAELDDMLITPELPAEVAEQLETARSQIGPAVPVTTVSSNYEVIGLYVGLSIESHLTEIRSLANDAGGASELTNAVSVLELSADLRRSVAQTTEAYFAVRFYRGTASDHQTSLERALITYTSDLEELELVVLPQSDLKALWSEVDTNPEVVALLRGVTASAASDPLAEDSATGLGLLDLSNVADTFFGSLDAVDSHVTFAAAASDQVVASATQVRSDAEASRNQTVALVSAIGLAGAAAVVGASLWIVRPLRQMAAVVGKLNEGQQAERIWERGPAEVRAAARALNEAVDSMNVAEQMANALAERNLDSPALKLKTGGRLGASLENAVSSLAASTAEREQYRKQLVYEATHDGLTGVANRTDTIVELDQALGRFHRGNLNVAVLLLDLDGFKSVNESHGHATGDEVLRIIAARIQETVRNGDHVGRLGGDEFAVIAEPVSDPDEALRLGERLLAAVTRPVVIGSIELTASARVGVALATASSTPEDLLRDADLALLESKSGGSSESVCLCDEDLKARHFAQATTERELESALANNELELYFQPIVAAVDGNFTSVEALLRWQQPSGDFIPPGIFIPIAERSDLIVAIDTWVLNAIAAQMAAWAHVPGLDRIGASVNISARHLSGPALVAAVLNPLKAHSIDPARLTIEVTETALLDDLEQAIASLHTLRASGTRIAIDDFGTGYASLAHLRRLPVDILKIDQSFVAGLDRNDDRSLVQLTIDTGHLLGATITAEGVETAEQHRQLVSMGTDHLQGFGLARPMPASQLPLWLSESLDPIQSELST